ncbi:MAG TPA: alpha/beta fold hydrolase [Polyangiaceae bacterium]
MNTPSVLLPMAERFGRATLHWRGARSVLVPTAQGTVHAYDIPGRGSLPTTVLLHGLGSAATSFAPLLLRLRSAVRRLIAPDYPGHGFSSMTASPLTADGLMAAVSTVLDVLVDEPALIIGNSLGGGVALRYAIAHPERVWALVLVSPAGAQSTEEELAALKHVFDIGSRPEALTFLRRLYPHPPGFVPLIAHELPAAMARPAIRDLLASSGNDDVPAPEALARLRMPILLLWGQEEHLLPDSHLDYFERHLPPHAIIARPEGFGHCPHVDAPEALAQWIVDFAHSVPESGGASATRRRC